MQSKLPKDIEYLPTFFPIRSKKYDHEYDLLQPTVYDNILIINELLYDQLLKNQAILA
jgi:hypothetical protein